MSTAPLSITTERQRAKPRLLIFDDDVRQLNVYYQKFSEHFQVEAVLVPKDRHADLMLKAALANGRWREAAESYYVDAAVFKCVRHIVSNEQDLRTLLNERQPDAILSDFQMRPFDGPLDGKQVMAVAAELLPDVPRAIHTGAGCASATPINELHPADAEDRLQMLQAMHAHGFKVFPKPLDVQKFDPAVLTAYFDAAAKQAQR